MFMTPDAGLDSEARGLVCLGFYQKELAQHLYACLDRPQASFCADREIDPVFKVLPSGLGGSVQGKRVGHEGHAACGIDDDGVCAMKAGSAAAGWLGLAPSIHLQ